MVRRRRVGVTASGGTLVPTATTSGQCRLEAELLLAVRRAMAGLRRRGYALRPTMLVSRAQTDSGSLGLQVHDAALDHLLGEALPRVVGGQLLGVPGLRVHPRRDRLDLRLITADGRTNAEVRLSGVTRERWRDAIGALEAAGAPVDLALGSSLDERESAALDAPEAAPVALMSGLLRRLPLWKGADWLDCVVVGNSVELYWRGGPQSESIAAILAESLCGIPGATAVPYRLRNAVRGMAVSAIEVGAQSGPERIEPEWAWIDWQAATAPGPAVYEHAVRPVRDVPGGTLPDVWEQRDMRDALAVRDIVRVYRLLCRHGVAPGRIASFTGQSEDEVGEILQGRTVQAYDTLVDIAEGLGVPLGYMGLAHDEAVADNRACVCADLDEVTKRRMFLAHAALVTVGQAVLGAVPRTWSGCGSQYCRAESTRHVLEEVHRQRAALLAELA